MGPASARQRNAISIAFRWWADVGPFVAASETSIPPINLKKVIKFGPLLTQVSGSAHDITDNTLDGNYNNTMNV